MNHHDDEIQRAGHMTDEADLRALLAPRRPDAAAFRAGVAARVLARGDRSAGGGELPAWRRRAAALLPVVPYPGMPFPGTGAGILTSLLSLPALLLASTVALFVRSDRRLRRNLPHPADHTAPIPRGSRWLGHLVGSGTLGSLVGGGLLAIGMLAGPWWLTTTILVLLLLSMLVVAAQVVHIARRHLAPFEPVGTFLANLMLAALLGCFAWANGVQPTGGATRLGMDACQLLLMAGLLCVEFLRYRHSGRPWRLFVNVLLLLPLLAINGALVPNPGLATLRNRLTNAAPAFDDLNGWGTAALIGDTLRATGQPIPALPALRARLQRALDDGTEPHPVVWTAAAHLNLLDAADWQKLAARPLDAYALDQLVSAKATLPHAPYDEYLLHARSARQPLTDAERENLVQRLDRAWPQADDGRGILHLGHALLLARWLRQLGRGDLVAARTPELHDLLRRHYAAPAVAKRWSTPGGFASQPGPTRHADPSATRLALQLIAEVGAPPEVPLAEIAGYLRHQARMAPWLLLRRHAPLVEGVQAELALLTDGIGLPARSLLQTLVDERLFLGALLFVVLCLRALWLLRPRLPAAVGALP